MKNVLTKLRNNNTDGDGDIFTTSNKEQEHSDHEHTAFDKEMTKKNLPSEQDRKATLGCLAAVLNIMFQYQNNSQELQSMKSSSSSSKRRSSSTTTTKRSDINSSDIGGEGEYNDDLLDSNNGGGGLSKQRTKEFQKELLLMSTEMLYLNPDLHAIEFLPILNNNYPKITSNDDDDDETTISESLVLLEKTLLEPFLSSFSSAEAGFDCISLLLFRFLLLSNNNDRINLDYNASNDRNDDDNDGKYMSQQAETTPPKTIIGYDSRVRYAFKYLSVSILKYFDPIYGKFNKNKNICIDVEKQQQQQQYPYTSASSSEALSATKYGTRKFEVLEDVIVQHLSIISNHIIAAKKKEEEKSFEEDRKNDTSSSKVKSKGIKKKNSIIRGIKIGTVAIGAGSLIALSGGIAVPAIVGGLAAVAGFTALSFGTLAALSLLVLPATITIFGVGSGLLVAKKMNNRTLGLTDFTITPAAAAAETCNTSNQIDTNSKNSSSSRDHQEQQQQHLKLSRTICINGWITDEYDFERPFGIQPKLLDDKNELLKRYCSVYAPQVIPNCDDILKEWKNNEDELWDMLRDAYGKDPNLLYPIDSYNDGNCNLLSMEEYSSINTMMGNIMGIENFNKMLEKLEEEKQQQDKNKLKNRPILQTVSLLDDVLTTRTETKKKNQSSRNFFSSKKKSNISASSKCNELDDDENIENKEEDVLKNKKYRPYIVWDFESTYRGMELYTISWEKELLYQIRGSAMDLQKDIAMKGVEQAIKKTIFASLMSAVALPATLLGLTNIIDEKWTLANERADEAGILLAESLLTSTAGHRPINLIGISFGARMIISCLNELARHQKKWEKEQQQQTQQNSSMNLVKRGSTVLLKAGDSIRKSVTNSVTSKLGGSMNTNDSNRTNNGNNTKAASTSYLREPASMIENVILMGCPASVNSSTWKSIRSIVAGRLINCYAGNDLMLALMYRLKNPTKILNPPVGIIEVKDSGVSNYDVSNMINTNHGEYRLIVKDILDLVGFDQPLASSAGKCGRR